MRIQVIMDQGPSLFQYELILTNLSDDSPIFQRGDSVVYDLIMNSEEEEGRLIQPMMPLLIETCHCLPLDGGQKRARRESLCFLILKDQSITISFLPIS